MNDINDIRNEALTEDTKMEKIADELTSGEHGIQTVEIHDATGTLSDEDYQKIAKDNCIIIVDTQYYYKQFHAATIIRYGAFPRVPDGIVVFEYIDIDVDTKSYELKNETYPTA